MRIQGLTLLVGVIAGCGGGTASQPPASQYVSGFTPPAPVAAETVYVSPVIPSIKPGTDSTYCSYLDVYFDKDTDISNFRVYQSQAGHHVIIYAARHKRPVDTHICTDDDMVNSRFIGAAGQEGAGTSLVIPDGLTFRIPAGSQIMFQTHWINAGTAPVDGQAVAYLTEEPSSAARTPLDMFNVLATQFKIPPGQTGSYTTSCTLKQDLQFFTLAGHQHERGQHVTISSMVSGGTTPKVLWDVDWKPEFQTYPPYAIYGEKSPLQMKAGDTLSIKCDWKNDTTKDLAFPSEMCVASAFYFPGDGEIDCEEGDWPTM